MGSSRCRWGSRRGWPRGLRAVGCEDLIEPGRPEPSAPASLAAAGSSRRPSSPRCRACRRSSFGATQEDLGPAAELEGGGTPAAGDGRQRRGRQRKWKERDERLTGGAHGGNRLHRV
ncbi:hypothetical protein PVAP13_9KG111820 [Panicum virgatum]|uniref:Uncharacterized protein n=1 Tax=Panicum virgatum TaxID=38727 RepID=A0A8T0NKE6_PANVG|nr:hypothetical protein PVAP13_9KG111820 [Panicum virgatum]